MGTIFDQPNTDYSNSGTINDGVTIAAPGILLTNTDSGRIYGGVTFTIGGSTLINELGGVVRLSQFDQAYDSVIVSGSDGADIVINGGLIGGAVALAGGADTYIDRDGSAYRIDLGSGDDTYRLEGSQIRWSSNVEGGTGFDSLVIANTSNDVRGNGITGFEALVLETGGNLSDFSGYQSITITQTPTPGDQLSFFNLVDCLNPTVDLTVAGQSIALHGSSLRSITGGDQRDSVELGLGSTISAGISLGGGDDWITLDSNQTSGPAAITFPVDGGSGIDTLMLTWFASGDRGYDFSFVQGFEKLNVNAWYVTDPATARISNISGLTDIDVGQRVTLILSNSISPDARIGGGFGGGITLEAGTVISRYGFPEDGFWDNRVDIAQGDPARSTTIINHGTISGAVRFYIGDDLYDGRDGTVGGTIYGNAGNDTLLGGAGAETMEGGYGADTLEGNGGADTLTGGAGSDVFRGTAAGLGGDTITDFSAGDKIVITGASLAGFSFNLSGNTLTYSGGSLALSSIPTGTIVASAAAGGGVQLTITSFAPAAPHAGDFNGDGKSDILWREDQGTITDWLGQANGGFSANWANSTASVPTDWKVAGTGDFNGDGRDDILWRNDSGLVADWLGTATGGFTDNYVTSAVHVPTHWKVAGTGDFNGDGKDDILWRNDNGQMTDWLGTASGGFSDNYSNAFQTVTTDWHIAATGDFNGDGKDDILWRSDSGLVVDWLGNGNGGLTSNYANSVAQVSIDWKVVGTGDFNGDGRDDILWRSDNGLLVDWLGQANGSFTPNWANSVAYVPTGWHVASIGDFNGDGREDILWRSDSGQTTDWLGTPSGGFSDNYANAAAFVPTNWHIQAEAFL